MTVVVSDSSPLITLARIGHLGLLPKLYGTIHISTQVYEEIVVAGNGLPGSIEIARATWIDVTPLRDITALNAAVGSSGLGLGELSAIVSAGELAADLVLIDEARARRHARKHGFAIIGCIWMLEDLYALGILDDLRGAYLRLLQQKMRIDKATLELSLARFELPSLS